MNLRDTILTNAWKSVEHDLLVLNGTKNKYGVSRQVRQRVDRWRKIVEREKGRNAPEIARRRRETQNIWNTLIHCARGDLL